MILLGFEPTLGTLALEDLSDSIFNAIPNGLIVTTHLRYINLRKNHNSITICQTTNAKTEGVILNSSDIMDVLDRIRLTKRVIYCESTVENLFW